MLDSEAITTNRLPWHQGSAGFGSFYRARDIQVSSPQHSREWDDMDTGEDDELMQQVLAASMATGAPKDGDTVSKGESKEETAPVEPEPEQVAYLVDMGFPEE